MTPTNNTEITVEDEGLKELTDQQRIAFKHQLKGKQHIQDLHIMGYAPEDIARRVGISEYIVRRYIGRR